MERAAQPDDNCIFCAIVARKTPADIVFEDEDTVFFHDIAPKAVQHLVGITRRHIPSLASLSLEQSGQIGKLLFNVSKVAQAAGLTDGGYRVIANIGQDAGQEVKHLHFHILGGEYLGPMRC